MNFQKEKRVVRDLYAALDGASPDRSGEVLSESMAPDPLWRGFHPFGELIGPDALAEQFWTPLRLSLTRMQQRQDIFFAGRNEVDGFIGTWVVSMGHLMGLFDQPWLGIVPTGEMAFLRYSGI